MADNLDYLREVSEQLEVEEYPSIGLVLPVLNRLLADLDKAHNGSRYASLSISVTLRHQSAQSSSGDGQVDEKFPP